MKMRDDFPMIRVFQTDLGVIRLADGFAAEAAAKWPGSVRRESWSLCPEGPDTITVAEPKWVGEVIAPITALMAACPHINTLESLRALEPYGLKA